MTTDDTSPMGATGPDVRAEQLRTDLRAESVQDALITGSAATQTVGQSLSRKAERPDVWRIAIVVALFGVAVSIGVSVPAAQQAAHANATAAAAQKSTEDNRRRAEEAYTAAALANEELKRRGQAPVPLPAPTDDNAPEALVAAATARVLAALPKDATPSREELAQALAVTFMANPPTVPPELVAQAVAAHLLANPPTPGAPGETGQKGDTGEHGQTGAPGVDGAPGPPPSAAEIMAAFNAALADNPSLLCAGKGTFTLVKGVMVAPDPADPTRPRTRDVWTCEPTASTPPT